MFLFPYVKEDVGNLFDLAISNFGFCVQSVVASIACDPAVWNAVVKNDALVEFIQSQKTSKKPIFPPVRASG